MALSVSSDGSQVTLRLRGCLDALTAHALDQASTGMTEQDVVVDMAELRLIDSTGVRAIVALFKCVRDRRRQLCVIGLTGQPLRMLRLLGFDRLLAWEPEAGAPAT
jgi:anti-anti-sigma factor